MQNLTTLKAKFPKLKPLKLVGIATLNAIWNCQYEGQLGVYQEHAGIASCLEGLKLTELPQLIHLWEEDDHPRRAFYNLKILFVNGCDRLQKLVPFSLSFKNLRLLEVRKCHGMENLVTSSTAKSLRQLKGMVISECKRLIQIIGDYRGSDETEEGETVFDLLEVLELDNLPSLKSFYSEDNHLKFPNLKEVIVRSCCQMLSFCSGKVSTPKVKRLIFSGVTMIKEDEDDSDEDSLGWNNENDNEDWDFNEEENSDQQTMHLKEGDINATIRQLSERNLADT
ncbi:hypothetical protein FEM48_ZijujUnG0110900 [Ziziphus jujuba var. spinosa]|uniref:Disease resistance protein At4g27190-like leucine-rich repeats domain-containing protein n=1 Tax=Ziziphus jujuba var. spinosa TaxID=714518 RepID=A0A978U812_ZIZJJ|nr:hypothetical protein FEM48_ZijujUnG0110900 [Ziziphus jujuba var. spinosa]